MKIDIISDISCPFCALGYLQLKEALGEREANITWHPFDINPNVPVEGKDLRQNLNEKYGMSVETCENNFANFIKNGAALGFEFNYPKGKRAYPSIRGHQLIHWAQSEGHNATPLKMALLNAFFRDGLDYHDIDVLADVATSVGLNADEARAVLEDERFESVVRDEMEGWQQRGITGVPSIIFNDKFLVNGAQGVEAFKGMLAELESD